MGWLFTKGQTRQVLVDKLLTGFGDRYEVLDHKVTAYGRRLWVAIRHREQDNGFIALFLLTKKENYGWGYKDMDESAHPYYYDCPLSLLDITGDDDKDGSALEWRMAVRETHKRFHQEFEIGANVSVFGYQYRIESKTKRSYLIRSEKTGKIYCANAQNIEYIEDVQT